MNRMGMIAIVISAMITAGGFLYVHEVYNPPENGKIPSSLPIPSGTTIVISTSDRKEIGGLVITASTLHYYAITYEINVTGRYILTGSWSSSGETLVYLFVNNQPYMETPVPDELNGNLNQTIWNGSYTLVIGGYPGDVIHINKEIEISSYVPYVVGTFIIPSGTYVNSPRTYFFNLNKPAILIGEFTAEGCPYEYVLNGTSGGFSVGCYNSSSKPVVVSFSTVINSHLMNPGNYEFEFVTGNFYVNSTLEFLYYYDLSE
ncbi:MAG: hypothetical protein QW578_07750 [Thermoplasmatales archaeon]